jgi:hypothetical protein
MIAFLDFDGALHLFAERHTQPYRGIQSLEDGLDDYTFK